MTCSHWGVPGSIRLITKVLPRDSDLGSRDGITVTSAGEIAWSSSLWSPLFISSLFLSTSARHFI